MAHGHTLLQPVEAMLVRPPPEWTADHPAKTATSTITAIHPLDAAITVAKTTAKPPPTTTASTAPIVVSDCTALHLDDALLPQPCPVGWDRAACTVPPPPTPSPSPSPALQVRLNNDPNLGFCVYALRRYARGDVIYTERTAIEATHHPDHRGLRNVYQYYCSMSHERRRGLHGAFPVLAWANGVDADEAAEGRTLIASRVTTKGFVLDNRLSAHDHIRMRPDMALLLTPEQRGELPHAVALSLRATGRKTRSALSDLFHKHPSDKDKDRSGRSMSADHLGGGGRGGRGWRQRGFVWAGGDGDDDDDDAKSHRSFKSVGSRRSHLSHHSAYESKGAHNKDWARQETLKWFGRYAFRLKPGSAFQPGNDQAAVYLLTDLINHRCNPYQNCRVQPKIGFVSVIAERDIEPGEELTINYNKNKKDFDCRGECCR